MIGATTSKTLDLTLLNKGDIVYGTSTIKVEIGLKIGSTVEYIPMGIYNIDDIEKTDYTIKITAYDNMIKFEKNFTTTLGDYLTLQQVVSELTRITGVEFIGTLPSYSVKKLEGFSCREILSYVASICGGNVVVTRDGKFTIVTPKDINYSIGTSNYFDYKREETKYKIGKISCQAGEEVLSKGSLGADSMELEFENPWINASILTDIYNKLNGFEYLGYSMKWQGDLSLDVGDIVTITDKKGVVRKHPILSQKFTYTGGLTSEIGAKGENKNKNSYSSSGPSAKKVERVVMELALINKALIDVAYIGDLTAGNIKFDTASGTIMDLQTLLSKFITGENGQFLNLTTDNVTISNAVIKDVIAKNISVEDLKASTISTNKFKIASDNGGIEIVGATQQFKDKNNKVRIQMGQDTQGNFNFILRGEDGTTTLIDHTGIKEKAIADDLIKEKMIAENAVGEKQINYSSLITGLNKDTNTSLIKASKVAIDLTGQSLEVSFNSLKSNVDSKETRNLLLNSKKIVSNVKTYAITQYYFSQPPIEGELYTLTWKGNLPATKRWGFYNSGGYALLDSSKFGLGELGVQSITFIWNVRSGGYTSDNTFLQIYNIANDSGATGATIEWIKLEKGDNPNPVWTPAPEDIEEKIQANTTSITAVQGQVSVLISESSITKGDVTTLKDNYTSIKATVDGINTTVASHTSSIGNLTSNVSTMQSSITQLNNQITQKVETTEVNSIVNNAIDGLDFEGRNLIKRYNELKDMMVDTNGEFGSLIGSSLMKDYISVTPSEELWFSQSEINGGDNYFRYCFYAKDKVTVIKRTPNNSMQFKEVVPSGAYWLRVSYDTNNKVKLERGKKVTEWSLAPEDVESRVNSVEQSITATAITTTISSAINAGTSNITTTQFVMDKTGLTIKNGALTIKNKAGTNVLTSDTSGNLTIAGTFINYNSAGVKAIEINDTNIYFYDWERNGRNLGIIYSSKFIDYPNVRGFSLAHRKNAFMTIGYENSSGTYNHYFELDKEGNNPNYSAPIRVLEGTVFSQAVNMQNRVYIPGTMYFGDSAASTTSRIWGAPNTNRLAIQVSVTNKDDGFMIQSNTGSVLARILAGYSYPILLNNNTQINGNLDITGSKARLVNTKTFGGVRLNAVESASPVFEDIGEGITDDKGLCYIYIDPVMLETINSKCNYQVFIQKYGEGDLFVLERNEDYFIVKGTPNIKFGWRFVAKQRGYELERLEQEKIIIPSEFHSNIDDFQEVKYDELASEYLNNYEMELMNFG